MPTDAPYAAAALYGLLASVAILVGGGLVGPNRKAQHGPTSLFASLGAGFLIGLGALGAFPEALSHSTSPWVPGVIAAATLVLMLWLHRFGHAHGDDHAHDHGHDHGHAHEPAQAPTQTSGLSLYDSRMAVAGLALHSLLDGVAVSAALVNQHKLGLFVAFFVLLHKLPEGAAAAALTYASGGERSSARRGVMVVAGASLLGALAIFVIEPVLSYALAVTAGVTTGVGLGIAGHLRKQGTRDALIGVVGGALLFAAAEYLLHG